MQTLTKGAYYVVHVVLCYSAYHYL